MTSPTPSFPDWLWKTLIIIHLQNDFCTTINALLFLFWVFNTRNIPCKRLHCIDQSKSPSSVFHWFIWRELPVPSLVQQSILHSWDKAIAQWSICVSPLPLASKQHFCKSTLPKETVQVWKMLQHFSLVSDDLIDFVKGLHPPIFWFFSHADWNISAFLRIKWWSEVVRMNLNLMMLSCHQICLVVDHFHQDVCFHWRLFLHVQFDELHHALSLQNWRLECDNLLCKLKIYHLCFHGDDPLHVISASCWWMGVRHLRVAKVVVSLLVFDLDHRTKLFMIFALFVTWATAKGLKSKKFILFALAVNDVSCTTCNVKKFFISSLWLWSNVLHSEWHCHALKTAKANTKKPLVSERHWLKQTKCDQQDDACCLCFAHSAAFRATTSMTLRLEVFLNTEITNHLSKMTKHLRRCISHLTHFVTPTMAPSCLFSPLVTIQCGNAQWHELSLQAEQLSDSEVTGLNSLSESTEHKTLWTQVMHCEKTNAQLPIWCKQGGVKWKHDTSLNFFRKQAKKKSIFVRRSFFIVEAIEIESMFCCEAILCGVLVQSMQSILCCSQLSLPLNNLMGPPKPCPVNNSDGEAGWGTTFCTKDGFRPGWLICDWCQVCIDRWKPARKLLCWQAFLSHASYPIEPRACSTRPISQLQPGILHSSCPDLLFIKMHLSFTFSLEEKLATWSAKCSDNTQIVGFS